MKFSFLILFFLILSGASGNQETKFPEQKNTQESQTGNKQKSETGEKAKETNAAVIQSSISRRISHPEVSHPTSGGKKDNKENNPRNWFDWHVAFGPATWSQWALTILATIAAIAAWRTFRVMRKQLEISDDALKISERAWVTVKFDIPS